MVHKRYVVAKDLVNSSTDILITNIFMLKGGYLKAINYYAQPNRRKSSFRLLKKTIMKIRKAEPGIQIIIGGDFNHDLSAAGDKDYRGL